MAVDISEVQSQIEAPEAPAAPPAVPPQVEPTPDTGRGTAPEGQVPGEDQTPPVAEEPDLKDLFEKHPRLKRQADGMMGERIRREREAARAEAQSAAFAQLQAQQAQQVEAQAQAQQQQWLQQEVQYRSWEDQQEAYLASQINRDDPYDPRREEFEQFVGQKHQRRAQADSYVQQQSAQRQQQASLTAAEQRARQAMEQQFSQSDTEWFYGLPLEVQQQTAGRQWANRAEWVRATNAALVAHHEGHWQSDLNTRVEAEVAKRLGRNNLQAPGFDRGTGGAPNAGYSSLEALEAEYARDGNTWTPDEYRQRRVGLTYRDRRK